MGLAKKEFNIKSLLLSKINRKLTFLFLIVGLIAPAIAVFYFYQIALSAIPTGILTEQAVLLQTAVIMIIVLIAVNAGIIGFFVSKIR